MSVPHLRALAGLAPFRKLLRVRLVGQVSDGLLQAGLVGVVLFAPERAPSPGRIALGFAVLLLPFCLVAPLAGVVLDRWSRVRVLAWANLSRALLITVTAVATAVTAHEAVIFIGALIAIGFNRLVLAALGASLPRVVPQHLLVSGNALGPTLGTAATVVGAGAGLALRAVLDAPGDAAPFAAAAAGYLLAVLATRAFSATALGPDSMDAPESEPQGRPPGVLRTAWGDVRSGSVHIAQSAPARHALGAMAANRLLFGAYTVWTIIVIRFHLEATQHDEVNGLAALGGVALAIGVGLVLAALAAPPLVRARGPQVAATVSLATAGVGALVPLLSLRLGSLLVAWVLVGGGAQLLKITVDTVLQRAVGDDLRGRIFIAYDLVFNAAFVVGVTAVATLPMDALAGTGTAAAVGLVYFALAVVARRMRWRYPWR
jgi:MFS family permease